MSSIKVAFYTGRPLTRGWHTDARIYTLDPPLLGAVDGGYLMEIRQILVSGIREATTMELDGRTVYRLHTVAATLDEGAAIWEVWLEGRIDHTTALAQIGYITEGKP